MKSTLILGLGNTLMGDDGVGWRVAELLAADPRLPADAEALCAGTDLFRWAGQMEGRERVVLIDAILGDQAAGTLEIFEDQFPELETRQWNVHHLSTTQSIRLLQAAVPAMREVHFTLLGVTISSVGAGPGLSPALNALMPGILAAVLRCVERGSRPTEI